MAASMSPLTFVSEICECVSDIWAGSVSMAALISSWVPITTSHRRSADRMATPKARGSCHWSGRKSMSSTTLPPARRASSAANIVALRLGSREKFVPANCTTRAA